MEGKEVVVWADGAFLYDMDSPATVTSGTIPNPTGSAYSDVIIGLPYVGRWKSVKLAYGAGLGTPLTQYKRVNHVGLVMLNTAPAGLRMGRDFDNLTQIATKYRNQPITPGQVFSEWDQDASAFSGKWGPDERVHLEMRSPYPVSIAALVYNVKTSDRG